MLLRVIGLLAAATWLAVPASAASDTGIATGGCAARTARMALATPRDCTIRGEVSGTHIANEGPGFSISWHGELVLKQEVTDPVTGGPPAQPTFAVAPGSSVTWEISGSGNGGCTDSGGGTLAAGDLSGDLTITGPQSGKWSYSLDVAPRSPRGSNDVVMPYTVACPTGTSQRDASLTEGLLFGYNGRPPTSNMITDGMGFDGAIQAPETGSWSWNLSGEVFPQEVSEHGIAFIKAREGLRLHAYEDQLHLCTIGYGHLILPEGRCGKRASMHWTHAEADAELRSDLDKLMEPYLRKASIRLGMNQCEYDALASFAYNVAHGRGGPSASWNSLMAGTTPNNWQQLVEERLPKYVYGFDAAKHERVELPDLVKRRARELHMFMAPTCPCDGVAQ